MTKIYLFATVVMKEPTKRDLYGPMRVMEIRSPEEAEHYRTFPIMCRSLVDGEVRDFHESELLVVEEESE